MRLPKVREGERERERERERESCKWINIMYSLWFTRKYRACGKSNNMKMAGIDIADSALDNHMDSDQNVLHLFCVYWDKPIRLMKRAMFKRMRAMYTECP